MMRKIYVFHRGITRTATTSAVEWSDVAADQITIRINDVYLGGENSSGDLHT